MNRFAYRVYCEYNGATDHDPARLPNIPHSPFEALMGFSSELPHYLSDQEAIVIEESVETDANSINVIVVTTADEAATDEAVQQCLNRLALRCEKQKQV